VLGAVLEDVWCDIVRRMIKHKLERIIKEALKELSVEAESVVIESPADSTHGDYATNVSFVYAGKVNKNPGEFAEDIKTEIENQKSKLIDRVETAGPGFINFFVSQEAIEKNLKNIKNLKKGYEFNKKEKINIEFISANPTGALHIGHGRSAFYGDILSNIFSYTGAEVAREYYINDSRESVQIKELGKTALGIGEQYKTKEIEEMISGLGFSGLDESEAGFVLAEKIQEKNQKFVEDKLGIRFDEWYSEDEKLRASGANDDMLEKLSKHSQLIVITHNRETMSRADILYGVTMGSDAVSKLLSVRFDEAAAYAK